MVCAHEFIHGIRSELLIFVADSFNQVRATRGVIVNALFMVCGLRERIEKPLRLIGLHYVHILVPAKNDVVIP